MAYQFYVSLKGSKQGQFKGESTRGNRRDKWTEIIGFNYAAQSPNDQSAGRPAGQRQHPPITITKTFGPVTPLLLQALQQREVLTDVTIERVEPSGQGSERIVGTVRLINAVIVDSRPNYTRPRTQAEQITNVLTDFTFTFQQMKIDGAVPLTGTAADDWAT